MSSDWIPRTLFIQYTLPDCNHGCDGNLGNKVNKIQTLSGILSYKITSTLYAFCSLFGYMSSLAFHNDVKMSFTNGK